MNGQTGTWGTTALDAAVYKTHIVAAWVMLICACGAAFSIYYLWKKHLRDELIQLKALAVQAWYMSVRNPASWLVQPVRQAFARWSAKNLRETMAKWRKGHLANAFYETIHKQIELGIISAQQGKQLQSKMAIFFGLDDLARIKTHENAVRHRLALNRTHEAGPKINQDSGLGGTKPCWGDEPQPHGPPPPEALGGKFLQRKKVA